jgi:DNA polymerase
MGLGRVSKVLGFPADKAKSKRGKALIQKVCKPNSDGVRINDPFLLDELYDYCKQDVVAEKEVDRVLPPLPASEQAVWIITQEINERGIQIDRASAKSALAIYEAEKTRLYPALQKMTGIENPGSAAQFQEWLIDKGYEVEDCKASTLQDVLDTNPPKGIKDAIELRIIIARSPITKYAAMLRASDEDGRLRFSMMYYGATTGRYAGRLINPQNFPRPSLKDPDACIDLLHYEDGELLDMFFGEPVECLSSCLRGMLCAAENKRFLVSDWSSIEGRILPWQAGQEDKVQMYREHGKAYEYAASKIYRKEIDDVTKDERSIGKIAELALGYQGAKGAFRKFADTFRVDITDALIEKTVEDWRAAHPKIVKYWEQVEKIVLRAVQKRGTVHSYRGIKAKADKNFLYIKLLSGRKLYYFKPSIGENKWGRTCVECFGTAEKNSAFIKKQLYGGLITENITQAHARDVLTESLIKVDLAGYPIVLHVHDEIVCETEKGRGSLDELIEIMCENPTWTAGLPLRAAGYESARFKKD